MNEARPSTFAAIARWVLTHRRTAWALGLLVFVLCCAGLSRQRIDFRFQSFFGSSDPAVAHLLDFIDYWGTDESLLFVLVETEGDFVLGAKGRVVLDDIERAVGDVEGVKTVLNPLAIKLPADEAGALSLKSVRERVDGLDDETARALLVSQDDLVPMVLSQDGRRTLMFIELDLDADNILAFEPVLAGIRAALAPISARPGIEVFTAGIPAVRADMVEGIKTDQTFFLLLSLLAIVVLLYALFRSWYGVLIPSLAAIVPTAMTFGVMGWADKPIGMISQVYATLLPVIAVADAIHVISRYHQRLVETRSADGDDAGHEEAIIFAFGHVGRACFLASVTTAIGFLSLLAADMTILQSFGLFAALGVLLAFLSALLILPLGLFYVRRPRPPEQGKDRITPWLGKVAEVAVRYRISVLAFAALLFAAGGWAADTIPIDNALRDVLGDDHETTKAADRIDAHLSGMVTPHLDIQAKSGDVLDEAALLAIDTLEHRAAALPDVRAVQGPGKMMRALKKSITGQAALPATRAESVQLLFLADDRATSRVLGADKTRARVMVWTQDKGGSHFSDLCAALDDHVKAAETAAPQLSIHMSGIPFVALRGFNRLSTDMLKSLLMAIAFITLVVFLLFRRVLTALISLVPNLLPLLLCLLFMRLTDWRLNPTGTIVFTVAIGMAVDDTIHLLSRFREEGGRKAHIAKAVTGAGRAVLITSVVLVVGFGINGLSAFMTSRTFGVLGALAIFFALVCDLLLLPALLSFLKEEPSDDGLAAREPLEQ